MVDRIGRLDVQALVAFVGGADMANEVEVFHFEEDRPSFESMGKQNGFRFWLASDLRDMLAYSSIQPVLNAVNKAMSACASLNIPITENFSETKTPTGGRDFKLSRFACYLTVMNGDPKKPRVAQAQAYFITMAEAFREHVQESDSIERVVIRGEVADRETALSATVSIRGIEAYPFFQNAGYRGMYNLDLKQIREKKGVPATRSVLDFMGKTELAANLFRITQTEEKIRNEDIRGQAPLERAANMVGRGVRQSMIELGGSPPERLPAEEDIKQVKKALKKTAIRAERNRVALRCPHHGDMRCPPPLVRVEGSAEGVMTDFESFTRDQIVRLRAEADALEKVLKAYEATQARASGAARRSGGDQPRPGAFGAVMEAIGQAGRKGLNLDEMIAAAEAEGYAVKRATLRAQVWKAKEDGALTQIEPGRYRSSTATAPADEAAAAQWDDDDVLGPALAKETAGRSETFLADLEDEIPF